MELAALLPPQRIALGLRAADRAVAVRALVALAEGSGAVTDAAALTADVLAREAAGPTDTGGGIAVPHAKTAAVSAPVMAAATLRDPLPGADGADAVRVLFLIAVPAGEADAHVRILADLAGRLMQPGVPGRLAAAQDAQAFLAVLQPGDGAQAAPAPQPCRVAAVTACPAGIAHTFMAKQALLEQADVMGIPVRVEADGAAGIEDPLTSGEIAEAECILIAADRAVEMQRFTGKPLVYVPVGEAVRHPEQLLHRALSGTAPEYQPAAARPAGGDAPLPAAEPAPAAAPGARTRAAPVLDLAHRLYNHLMSGITRMLPFVTGGGILIALSFLLSGGVIAGHEQGFPGLLYTVGQYCFALMYVVLAGFIASSIGGVPAFVPGAMGGYFAYAGITLGDPAAWVSGGFWGALIAGFSAGALLRGMTWLGNRLPKNLEQIKVTLLYPAVSLFLMTVLMVLIVNPPLGRFNQWIYAGLTSLHGGSRLVLCAALGGLMAIDYGGPVNKAAYLFGTVALMNGQYDIMAAVMVGGMTPPIGIAVACLLFPDRFTQGGRRAAPGNFLLGASFVTEGALPFALRDPLRVIPACFAGSVLAGLLCQWLGCGVPAPHGGLFLLPVMTNPGGFVAALAAGTALTALLLRLLKRPLSEQAAATPETVLVRRQLP